MKFEHEEDGIKIVFELKNEDMTVDEVFEQFEYFMLACSYQKESINDFYIQVGEERAQGE
jgi:hypothetical protein